MLFLLLANDTFQKPLEELGHRALVCGPQAEADLPLPAGDPQWPDLKQALKREGLTPDAILVTDDIGCRCLPSGLGAAPCPTVFYGLDSPFNRFWQRPYARLFDIAFLDQLDQSGELALKHPGAAWLPLGIDPARYQGEIPGKRKKAACFVGALSQTVRPKRSALLAKAAQTARLTVKGGRKGEWVSTEAAAALYREHRVVINENLFRGVTSRPLEIMAAGGTALSEAAPGHMDVLFRDFEHLVYFTPGNFTSRLEQLLEDGPLGRRIARGGREEVLANHTLVRRAEKIVSAVLSARTNRAQGGEALRLEGEALLMAGLRWPGKQGKERVLRGALRLKAAALDGAKLLPARRGAALGLLAIGQNAEAAEFFAMATELGKESDQLRKGLALWGQGRSRQAAMAFKGLAKGYPELSQAPGTSSFHRGAARLLAAGGRDLEPGFSLAALPPVFWTALEHLAEALRQDPGDAESALMAGDILAGRGQMVQAHEFYQRSHELKPNRKALIKAERAAREGFLL